MKKFRESRFWRNYKNYHSVSGDSSVRGFADALLFWRLFENFPKHDILEIGSYQGLTTGLFLDCISDAQVTSIDILDRLNLLRWYYAQDLHRHQFHQSSSEQYDFVNNYDVIFIDGDHSHQASWSDIQSAVKCIRPNGILIIDDYTMPGVAKSITNLYNSQNDWVPFMQGIQTQFWHHRSQDKSQFLDQLLQDPISNIVLMENIRDNYKNNILQARCVRALTDHYEIFDQVLTIYNI